MPAGRPVRELQGQVGFSPCCSRTGKSLDSLARCASPTPTQVASQAKQDFSHRGRCVWAVRIANAHAVRIDKCKACERIRLPENENLKAGGGRRRSNTGHPTGARRVSSPLAYGVDMMSELAAALASRPKTPAGRAAGASSTPVVFVFLRYSRFRSGCHCCLRRA
jgi:hypothetical protein